MPLTLSYEESFSEPDPLIRENRNQHPKKERSENSLIRQFGPSIAFCWLLKTVHQASRPFIPMPFKAPCFWTN